MTNPSDRTQRVLIVGASFAGLTTAFWMHRLGYAVTVVEIGNGLKMGGSPVDIKEGTVDIMQRMGLLQRIQANSLKPKAIDFLDANGGTLAKLPAPADQPEAPAEYEIERDTLLTMLFEEVRDNVEFLFQDSIAAIDDNTAEHVNVTFHSGKQQTFHLLFGCDGIHSSVRKRCFGPESDYSLFLQNYFSITIVDTLLIPQDTAQMYNVPGKVVMLNAYNNKTDIIFCFHADQEIPYDYRDPAQQHRLIHEHFQHEGWRTQELLEASARGNNFYFDKMCQIKMPSWTKGRIALVGDAGYCASPAAGMGGSLAIVGATALADAFQKYPADHGAAFQHYEATLRPFVDTVQTGAIQFGLETFVPASEEAIQQRNARLRYSS